MGRFASTSWALTDIILALSSARGTNATRDLRAATAQLHGCLSSLHDRRKVMQAITARDRLCWGRLRAFVQAAEAYTTFLMDMAKAGTLTTIVVDNGKDDACPRRAHQLLIRMIQARTMGRNGSR
jgi:hypothetical protein